MIIRVKKGVSGYRENGNAYRYPVGYVGPVDDVIGFDLIKTGIAEPYEDLHQRPIAVAPSVDQVVKAVVKRKRNV